MPGKAGETSTLIQQVPEESRDEEKKLHAESVDGERKPRESLAGGDIRDDSIGGRCPKVPRGVEDNTEQQGEGTRPIEGVETVGFGGVAHDGGCFTVKEFRAGLLGAKRAAKDKPGLWLWVLCFGGSDFLPGRRPPGLPRLFGENHLSIGTPVGAEALSAEKTVQGQ